MLRRAFVMAVLMIVSSVLRADPPAVRRFTLDNGLRVLLMPVEGAKEVAVVSFLPLGLAGDGRERTQWSHLVEHLTLRTTGPITDYQARNAETMSDVMHLDSIGDDLAEGLDLQARWLSSLPFTEETRREEIPKATFETVGTVRALATHKWATAAWNQVFRHGQKHVAIRGALEEAGLAELQAYRDRHLISRDRVLLLIVGGVDAAETMVQVERRFGGLELPDNRLPAATAEITPPADVTATWDLDGRHFIEAYRIPAPPHPDHPALLAASTFLAARLAMDRGLREHAGMVSCAVDLVTPEATYLTISASVKPEADLAPIVAAIDRQLQGLRDPAQTSAIPMVARNRSLALAAPPDLNALLRQKPAHVSEGIALGNLGLYWGLQEYRYGEHREALAKALATVTAADVARVAEAYLTPANRLRLRLLAPEPD